MRLANWFFDLCGAGEWTPALLRLVVEAGQGVTSVGCYASGLPLSVLREELVPVLQQPGASIRTLCFAFEVPVGEEWCAGLLGALPACIMRVQVVVDCPTMLPHMVALVRGGVEGLRHPLTLALQNWGGISDEMEAELRGLVAGSGGGPGAGGAGAQQQQGSLLTLEIER